MFTCARNQLWVMKTKVACKIAVFSLVQHNYILERLGNGVQSDKVVKNDPALTGYDCQIKKKFKDYSFKKV